jgi:hypothetical protein
MKRQRDGRLETIGDGIVLGFLLYLIFEVAGLVF